MKMLTCLRFLRKIRLNRQNVCFLQTQVNQKFNKNKESQITPKTLTSKYQAFRDEDSEIILDIYEQDNKYGDLLDKDVEETNPLDGINLEHGKEGVYDIEDLVTVLRHQNSQDIFVASVPQDIKYVDYICLVTGRSHKHMRAIAQFVRTVFKKKMHKHEIIPKVEGNESKDWIALDLGNIALHIFSPNARILYDLDSLWSVGPQYDSEFNKKDPISEILEKHSVYLSDLKPQ